MLTTWWPDDRGHVAPGLLGIDNDNPCDTALLPHHQSIRQLCMNWSHMEKGGIHFGVFCKIWKPWRNFLVNQYIKMRGKSHCQHLLISLPKGSQQSYKYPAGLVVTSFECLYIYMLFIILRVLKHKLYHDIDTDVNFFPFSLLQYFLEIFKYQPIIYWGSYFTKVPQFLFYKVGRAVDCPLKMQWIVGW